ncbi:MAG: hypothetical protein JSV91_02995 [Phycisphaerales bacterium]|nr:MAG: hypothetical protein JSV91_02995 [Phycisphaerales bacterium]
MSVRASRTKLLGMMKDLQVKWEATKSDWNDPMSRELEKNHLAPLERKMRAAVTAMEQMSEILAKAQRECG